MRLHHVVWQSPEGSWASGHFKMSRWGDIDFSEFLWVERGFFSKDDAATRNRVPGTPYIVVLYTEDEEQVLEFERLADAYDAGSVDSIST